MIDPYEKGYEAYTILKSMNSNGWNLRPICPYEAEENIDQWTLGFEQAKKDLEEKEPSVDI
jgi:ribosome modulation factor